MSVMKVIELMGQSPESWEAAVQEVVEEANKTLRGIQSVYVQHFMVEVKDGKIANYRVDTKVTFKVE
ncbi:MAG: dodecin family protein [bacterium]|nr:dodecin family protein [bacterium]